MKIASPLKNCSAIMTGNSFKNHQRIFLTPVGSSFRVLLEQNKQRGKYLKSRGHFRLPECEELPRYNRSSKIPTCSYVGLTEINQAEISCKFIFTARKHHK